MLHTLTLKDAITGIKAKQFSAAEITRDCLSAIDKHNTKFNAYLHVNTDALAQATKSDPNSPLAGVPIAVKDNILTVGLPTTASSFMLKNYMPQYSATIASKLLAAGATFLGKTNMDAWAHGSSTETSDFGSTKNPWNPGHLPGGSSGGSAAAVAADMCIAAIGTETAGSIRQPAAWCGITGLKPTYGRVSRYGVIAMASSTDSPGPMTKSSEDADLLLQILAGHDPYDGTSSKKTLSSEDIDIKSLRIGLPKEYLLANMRADVKARILDAAKQFEKMGARIEEISLLDPKYAIGVYTIIQRSEVSSNLGRYDGIRFGNTRESFGTEAKRRIMLGTYALSSGYYDEYYKKAQKVRTLIIKDFESAFSKVDLIIGPTSPGPALPIGASVDNAMFGEMEDMLVEASSIAGLPSINVPCGFVDALPIGLQITGPQWTESKILSAAKLYQSSTKWHHARPTL